MNSTLTTMKTTWKKLLIAPLLIALSVAPLCAEPINSSADTATNPAAAPAPIPPPEPPAVIQPPVADAAADTNLTPAPPKKLHRSSDDHPSVRIGPSGVHIGGSDPVDIDMPEFSHGVGSMMFWSGFVLPVVAVFVVFGFFAFVIGYFLYLRHRRHRILHETIRTMLEKGVPIPPELLTTSDPTPLRRTRSDLRNALIMLGIGVGMLMVLRGMVGRLGVIPILIGVAFLITWYIERKNTNNSNGPTNP
jgi:hypothetical protein